VLYYRIDGDCMNKFLPNMYEKDIYSINYQKLKQMGISLLLFDFDNTIVSKDERSANEKMISFFHKLQQDFDVIILSNTLKKQKIFNVSSSCKLKYIYGACKPFKFGYKRVIKNFNIDRNCVAAIGDQLLTDVWGANKMKIFSVLVDPVGTDDVALTKINRFFESYLFKSLNKKFDFEKGKYYD